MKSVLDDLWPNHDRKCGKSLTLKASSLRNLFYQDRRWIENSIAAFWGEWGKTSGANLLDKWRNNSWALHNDKFSAHMSLVVRQFLVSTKTTVIPPPSLLTGPRHLWFFLFPKMKLKLKGRSFDSIEEIQNESQDVMETLTRNDFQ